MELQEVFVWHFITNSYSYLFILYSMSFSMLFPCYSSSHTVGIYTSNIGRVGCISIQCRALAYSR